MLPRGTRLGVDVGSVRVGVASSDPDGLLATPLDTLAGWDPAGPGDQPAVCALVEHVRALGARVVYVGLPQALSGAETASTAAARRYAAALQQALGDDEGPVEVRLVDERLSTVTASAQLRASGRSARRQRGAIDRQAAVIILQSALDVERGRGERAGLAVGGTATQGAAVAPTPVEKPVKKPRKPRHR
ncbi:Holliday junction resolvase RuvX [Arsenicicoccus piscis]|uniref:Putative pre-16S rRNA nuclease n=1 Tax=Arsenicicoccus piscis TaxID=673954 RepID=A0ABQ6HKR6_9MICO|nr:Holliday junction resolvase RuvX [Arsenicicoccus piscis]MCH8627015.1 Holliday junction resolvase RuvX [Arsenicicoccus piscis]GMA19061.1 putative pre-16S rRNA nuclease [Arsenicicoccus piscis]